MDLYLTVTLAIVVGCLHILHVISLEITMGAMLATLALLATALLKVRRAAETLTQSLSPIEELKLEISSALKRPASLSELFRNRYQLPPLDTQWQDAQTIDICAMSLLALTTHHRELLLEKIKNGCKIRLILLNPKNKSLMHMVSRFVSEITLETHTTAVFASVRALTTDPVFNTHAFEVRTYDYPLGHGLVIINGELDQARLRVELFMAKGMPANAPAFHIYRQQDLQLFEMFKREFETIWERSSPCRSEGKEC